MHKFSAYIFKYHKTLLIITTILSFIYFLWEANSWKFSYVGDMWDFYTFAKRIIVSHYTLYPFSFHGVFGENSVLASYYQAFFLDLFGQSNLSWRLSNIVLIFPISYFFYRWLKLYFDWSIATIATLLLQFSFYLSIFFKIPYINPQAFALFIMSLYLAARAGMQPTNRNAFFLGLTLGGSFYIYLGALFPSLIWPYLLPLLKTKPNKKFFQFLTILVCTYIACLSLIIPEIDSLSGPQGKTVFAREFSDPSQIITNIGNNLLVFYIAFPVFPTHFIPFAYLDILSQLFALIGTFCAVYFFTQSKYRYLFLSYLSTVIILGITNPYILPPVTRGMFLLLFGFVFAAVGIVILTRIKYFRPWFIIPLVVTIIGANIYTIQYSVFQKIGYTGMALLVKNLQLAQTENKEVVLVLSPEISINLYRRDIPIMLQAYGLANVKLTILRPYEVTCAFVESKKTLVFSYDANALQKMEEKHCKTKQEVLTTPIVYY